MKYGLLFLALISFSACEVTPFDVKPDACTGLSIESNLQKLRELESANPNKTSFKVALVGDPQTKPQSMQQVVERINQRTDIDFMFVLGDLSDTGLQQEFDWVCKSLRKSKVPFITVVGNHDALSNGKEIWRRYFGPFDFSFSFLGTKFIAYNDNGYEFANVPDQDFLRREAEVKLGETRYHTIGASHVQPNSEVHDLPFQAQFLRNMNDAGIRMTIHGHRHSFFYQRDTHGNNHYVVASTWNVEWGIMTVNRTNIVMENCTYDNCHVVTAQ